MLKKIQLTFVIATLLISNTFGKEYPLDMETKSLIEVLKSKNVELSNLTIKFNNILEVRKPLNDEYNKCYTFTGAYSQEPDHLFDGKNPLSIMIFGIGMRIGDKELLGYPQKENFKILNPEKNDSDWYNSGEAALQSPYIYVRKEYGKNGLGAEVPIFVFKKWSKLEDYNSLTQQARAIRSQMDKIIDSIEQPIIAEYEYKKEQENKLVEEQKKKEEERKRQQLISEYSQKRAVEAESQKRIQALNELKQADSQKAATLGLVGGGFCVVGLGGIAVGALIKLSKEDPTYDEMQSLTGPMIGVGCVALTTGLITLLVKRSISNRDDSYYESKLNFSMSTSVSKDKINLAVTVNF